MDFSPQTDSRSSPVSGEANVDAFIGKWSDKNGGKRANYQLFIGELGESHDAHRKARQDVHPGLTMTDISKLLETLRSESPLPANQKKIHEQGLVFVLEQLHADFDAVAPEAYGSPTILQDEEVLTNLVYLNQACSTEEKHGYVRWLRPEYQAKRQKADFGDQKAQQQQIPAVTAKRTTITQKLPGPKTLLERLRVLRHTLEAQSAPRSSHACKDLQAHPQGTPSETLAHANELEKGGNSA